MATVTVHGDVDDGFGRVADAFAANFSEHGDVGAACAIAVDGQVVVDVWGGDADRSAARPWDQNTLVITFSTTKGATAVVCNRLIEQGRLDPEAPVAQYWPEFAANGKDAITVGDVLSHRSALAHCEGEFTLDEVMAVEPVRAAAAQAPNWDPAPHGYHARTYGWLLGEIVRRITGVSLGPTSPPSLRSHSDSTSTSGSRGVGARVARLYPPGRRRCASKTHRRRDGRSQHAHGQVMSGPSKLFRYDDMWNTRALHAPRCRRRSGSATLAGPALRRGAWGGAGGRRRAVPRFTDETVARATVMRSEGTDRALGCPPASGSGSSVG
jgi:hypothetical protein